MKKLLPFLIAFIFSITIKAQSPSLTFTNVTGSNSITCTYPSINYQASVSNYTAGPLTYTWVSLSGTASGTNVTLSNPSQYTVIAFNTANSFSLQQVFSIGINTLIPTSTVTPMTQNVTCPVGAGATFTGITTSTMTNITHSYQSPYSTGSAISNGTVSIFTTTGPGVYNYCLTNNINGCSTCKTITVTSLSGFPTYSVTSPTQFTMGCGSTSVTTINISNVSTTPVPGGPVSYTILPPSFVGPTYALGGAATYTYNLAGQYTVVVHDNTNNCETKIPISVIQNTFTPNISVNVPTQTLSCNNPSVILTGATTGSNAAFSWAFPGPGSPIVSNTIAVSSTSLTTNTVVSTYTLTVLNLANQCTANQSLTIYQNTAAPTVSIFPSNPSISCNTPTVMLTNASTSNVPPVFSPILPVTGLAWYGPVPQASVANSSSYVAYTPGTYTFVAKDLNNGCTSIATKIVSSSILYPVVSSPAPFNINCPAPTATIFPILTGPTTGFTYSWTVPPTATISSFTSSMTVVNLAGTYTIYVTNPVNGCMSSTLVTVAVCAGLEQNSLSNANISIFPNPTNGLFNVDITGLDKSAVIEVYSGLGVLVKKQVVTSENNIISLNNEAKGIYFVYVKEGEKAIKVSKIVKN